MNDENPLEDTQGSLVTAPNVSGAILDIPALAEFPEECSYVSDPSCPTGWWFVIHQQIVEINDDRQIDDR